jgi:hypothetical protein
MTLPASLLPYLIDCEQGSPAWDAVRRGKVTASRCYDLTATLKKGAYTAARDRYKLELVCETLTGLTADQYVSKEMQWGLDQEKYARAAYELSRDVMVETAGFVLHPDIPKFGCSPDGLVGDSGMIQIKCPNTATHLTWMLADTIPLEHCPQMLAELACTGREWSDFVSYDSRLPPQLQLFVKRMPREELLIQILEAEVVRFNLELEDMLSKFPSAGPQPVVEIMDAFKPDEMEF